MYRQDKGTEEQKRELRDTLKAIGISLGTLLIIVGLIIAMRSIGIR